MASGKTSLVNNSRIVLLLLGATICYQVVYQFIMLSYLRTAEDSGTEQCDANPDASTRCVELQLFRSWREAELAEQVNAESIEDLERLARIRNYSPSLLARDDARPNGNEVPLVTEEPVTVGTATTTSQGQVGRITLSGEAGLGKDGWSPISEWGRGLQAIQGHFEARMEKLPSVRRAHAVERETRFEQLYNETLAAINHRSSETSWAHRLGENLQNLQARSEILSRTHKHLMEKAGPTAPATVASGKGLTLLDEINQFTRELCKAPHRREYPSCKHLGDAHNTTDSHAARNEAKHEWRASMSGQLEKASSELEKQSSKMQASHHDWEEKFSNSIAAYMHDLCADPQRSEYAACATFHAVEASDSGAHPEKENSQAATTTTTTEVARGSLRGANAYTQRLSWSAVTGRSQKSRDKAAVSVGRDQLRFQKWQGRIPKVACIAAIPPGKDTHARMKYFLNNFKLQTYEGPKQLVLVYRHIDAEVAELVQEHADGTYIKGVASRDIHMPSVAAYRYAAWSTDADVIARWDFDDWHHPDRLAMQIRALGFTSRPVSILSRWTMLGSKQGSDQIMSSNPGWEGSLVGEAKWMLQHWMPGLKDELSLLAGVQAPWVAQVDIPELLVHHDAPHTSESDAAVAAEPHESSVFLDKTPKDTAGTEMSGSVCSRAEHEEQDAAPGATQDLGEKIDTSLGADFGKTYRDLVARRREVVRSLRSLCAEAKEEIDPSRQKALLEQAEHIASVQQQLADHFAIVDDMFHHV